MAIWEDQMATSTGTSTTEAALTAYTPTKSGTLIAVKVMAGYTAATSVVYGSTTTIAARASSGLAPVFASLTPATCAVDASTGVVRTVGAGTCTISIAQPGDGTR